MRGIFTSGNNIAAVAIKLATQCRWYHCGALTDDGVVYEARFAKGVIKSDLDEFKSRGHYLIIDYDVDDVTAATDFLESQVGKKYDYTGLYGYLTMDRDWQKPDSWYCSELLSAALDNGGTPVVSKLVGGVSPRDLITYPADIVESSVPWIQDLVR